MIRSVLARIFIRIYWISKQVSHKNLPGLGKALDLIKKEYVFSAKGRRYHFNPRAGRAYGLMIIGEWNEPETHTFLKDVLAITEGRVNFVNVGASIGEFVVDMAAHDKVAGVIAFEPQPESADAIERSCAVNEFQNVRIIRKIVADRGGDFFFLQDRMSPTSSRIARSTVHDLMPSQQISKIPGTTLDDELRGVEGKTIVLMDIEGEEYLAIQGGLDFIRKWKPLIIFEYNAISQASFDLNAVRNLLGPDYEIYRIRPDGRLDVNETNTWNMVAIARSSDFVNAVCSLQYHG